MSFRSDLLVSYLDNDLKPIKTTVVLADLIHVVQLIFRTIQEIRPESTCCCSNPTKMIHSLFLINSNG